MTMKIKSICEEIVQVLESVNDDDWLPSFKELVRSSKETDELKRTIRGMYGGMGSFNDLVLYNNGVLCKEETEKLDKLRTELFKTITLGS